MNNIDPGDTSGDVLAILQEQLESRNKTTESTVLIIFNIVALVGNAILCFIPDVNPKLRSSTTMLIVALACTDLLTTANVMPLTIDAVINSRRRFSDVCLFVCLFFPWRQLQTSDKNISFWSAICLFPEVPWIMSNSFVAKGRRGGGEFGFYNFSPCTPSWSFLSKAGEGGKLVFTT